MPNMQIEWKRWLVEVEETLVSPTVLNYWYKSWGPGSLSNWLDKE
jgi:hypothetical protein